MFITVIEKKAEEFIISRFQARRGGLQFVRGVRHLVSEEDISVEAILDSWRQECQGDRIVLALPATLFTIRELDLSVADRKRCREILPLELKGELASDADEPVYEALALANRKVAAIWSRQRLLAEEIEAFSARGFDPEVITFSLFNWRELLPEGCQGVVAVTDGESVAVYQDRVPLFFRALPQKSGKALVGTLAAVELAKEVKIERVFSLGSSLPTSLPETEQLPISAAIAAAFAGNNATATDLASHYAIAQELTAGEPVNLRRGPLRFTRVRDNLRKKLRLTYALAAALVILVFAEAGARFFIAQRELSSLNASIRSIYKEVFPARVKPVDEVAELKAEIKKLGATGSGGVLAALQKLTDAKGDGPGELYEVDFDGSQVTGRGYAPSAGGVNEFKAKALQQFAGFEVSEIKSRPDGSVSFAFLGTLQGGGK